LNYLKNTEFKILKINPGVVAALHVSGVRGDPCGAVRWTAVECEVHVLVFVNYYTIWGL